MNRSILAFLAALTAATPAFAHLDPIAHGSLAAGLSHPLTGLDHLLAMITVGLWSSVIGGRALWAMPLAFVGCMAVGFALALNGVALPFVEPGILASVIVLGLLTAFAAKMPTALGAALVGVFALFHGHAHGGEVGDAATLSFGIGFAISTAALHLAGIAFGLKQKHLIVTRLSGAAAAAAGVALAVAG
ncbi:protein hupE [Elstera cyanobacteriorum]|uniref:Protein hupE n=1 Tax=Elstera cyanobacteriorum TaxID=2022747 RepID=A0A255XT70_9PROT|nr:HupE/UreJ family protein [Elstera cyanobacteriorum]OYQ20168.1 protein hupE [Elstera cyanobacteriorum]GFZ81252.1 protein hupE [Elstera cyanobacteriorum]